MTKPKPSYRFYRGCYRVARAIFGAAFRLRVSGGENIPRGAAMVCANHSSLIDPILIALAFGIDEFMHFIAKIELFRIPILSAAIAKLGAISVDRETTDIATIKATLTYFKNGGKVLIFPEGTRTHPGERIPAKPGAVRIAERAGVPLVPVFVPREKRLFRRLEVVIGKPYMVDKQGEKRHFEEYAALSGELMGKIEALGDGAVSGKKTAIVSLDDHGV